MRAEFDCSTNSIQNIKMVAKEKDEEEQIKKEEEGRAIEHMTEEKASQSNDNEATKTAMPTTTTNVVAIRRKMFEQHQEKTKSTSAAPIREAPPPPSSATQISKSAPPTKHRKPTEGYISSQNLDILTPKAIDENNGQCAKGVRSMVEKLNKIGHRPFDPCSSTATNTLNRKNQLNEVDIALEVETDSSEESENEQKCNEIGEELSNDTGQRCHHGNTRRKSSLSVGCGEVNAHANILEEMRGKEIFKKSFITSEIPSEIGKYRPLSLDKKCSRKGCASDPPLGAHSADTISEMAQQTKTSSLFSSKNESSVGEEEEEQCLFVEHFAPPPKYSEMDEKENERLLKLHEVAMEIYQTQRSFVFKLQLIGLSYPRYLCECEKRLNRKWLHPKHVIKRIADHFRTILSVHLTFLHDFYDKVAKWDSRRPDLAEVFQKNADFLKICRLFLTEKQKLVAELQQVLNENVELADATMKFEQGLLNANSSTRHSFSTVRSNFGSAKDLKGISIVLQLDAVHQNVVCYKLLMERYRRYLPDNLTEAKNADEALKKLAIVTNDLNGSLTVENEAKKLLDLRAKLRGIFDVFAPGRKLLHSGELKRQTRKEIQSRHLVLFSDTLLICRSLAPLDTLDAKYVIPIEKVQLKLPENDESECEFIVLTPYKSSTFIAKSKWERDHWVKRIGNAVEEAIQRRATRAAKHKLAGGEKIDDETALSEGIVKSSDNSHFYVKSENSDQMPNSQAKCSSGVSETLAHNSGERLFSEKETSTGESDAANAIEGPKVHPNGPLFTSNTALWVPDNKTSKCMNGCGTSFAFLRRRHHCRQCGCIICSNCEGMAPVRNAQETFKRSKVCPECFFDIRKAFEHGLFPLPCGSNASIVAKLFIAPANGPMKKPNNALSDERVVSGKVFLRTHQKGTVLRWAALSAEAALQFYKAQFDDQPTENFFLFGYSLSHSEDENDGKTLIELTHRNQILTDREDDQIVFFVQHTESAKKWLDALRKVVQIEQPFKESAQG